MKYKEVLIATTGLAITMSIPLAASAHSYYWWEKPRKVIVTKNTRIEKIKVRYPRYLSYSVKSSTLKRGTVITTHHMASYDWSIQKKGYEHNSHYFWVMDTTSTANWMTPYSKYWIVWNKPLKKHQYVRATSKAYIYSKPGGKKRHNLKNYPHTTWYASRQEKTKSGALYYYVTNKKKTAKGWVWHKYLKRNPKEVTYSEKLDATDLSTNAFSANKAKIKIYSKIGGKVTKTLKQSDQRLLVASKIHETYKLGSFYLVTNSQNKFSGWVAKNDLAQDYTLVFKYADWKPYHTATDSNSTELLPMGKKPLSVPSTNYLKIGENISAAKYGAAYLIKRSNGEIGFYNGNVTAGTITTGVHNYFIQGKTALYTTSRTPMSVNPPYETIGYIPAHAKIYYIESNDDGYDLVSYNDVLVDVPDSYLKY